MAPILLGKQTASFKLPGSCLASKVGHELKCCVWYVATYVELKIAPTDAINIWWFSVHIEN